MANQVDGVVRHLLRQFTRRAHHQRAWVAALKLRLLVGSLRLGRFGGASPLACASAQAALESLALLGWQRLRAAGQQRVQHRQQEGGRLAAAGLAGHHQVGADRRCFVRGLKNINHPTKSHQNRRHKNCGHDVASDWLFPDLAQRCYPLRQVCLTPPWCFQKAQPRVRSRKCEADVQKLRLLSAA
jgi:hypothetical protein